MSLNFTAIDFETANRFRASVCSVGLAKVRDGVVVETTSWLISPPTGASDFEPANIAVHGILPEHVEGAIAWAQSLARIVEFIGDDVLVAYYAQFDKSVFRRASEHIGAEVSGDVWQCAWKLARKHLDLEAYKLPLVADHLGIEGLEHHDAESDARVCAEVVIALSKATGIDSVDDLWPNVPAPERANGGSQKFYSAGYSVTKANLPVPNPDANPDHPLFGQAVTITGEFERMDRMEAFHLAADFGASIELGTTRKTSILVVCMQDPYAPDFDLSQGSGKQVKAHKLIVEKGQSIRVISEQDFYSLIDAPTQQVGEL